MLINIANKLKLVIIILFFYIFIKETYSYVILLKFEYFPNEDYINFNESFFFEADIRGERIIEDGNYITYSVKNEVISKSIFKITSKHLKNNNKSYFFIDIPYDPKIKEALVYYKNKTYIVDLLKYNKCNLNSLCDEKEDRYFCPEDCQDSRKDNICYNIEDNICQEDPDCENKDPDCIIEELIINKTEEEKIKIKNESISRTKDLIENTKKIENNIFLISFIIIFLITIIYLYKFIRKKNNLL